MSTSITTAEGSIEELNARLARVEVKIAETKAQIRAAIVADQSTRDLRAQLHELDTQCASIAGYMVMAELGSRAAKLQELETAAAVHTSEAATRLWERLAVLQPPAFPVASGGQK